MIEEYISYWRLERHPFLLAPDSKMMCLTGQYFECLERLKYAINTGKGGVLVVSEDAGLGKTTLLMKLIDDMKERLGDAFLAAFIDHPTLSANQMIAQITGSITGMNVDDDKLKNLALLKSALIQAKEKGGKSIIVVDEGQMLCTSPDILQELRILINLTHNSEYLHTFILSGQRTLWNTVKGMPEFWQRLPVRYYIVPLKIDETKELIRYRLKRAGLEEEIDIFSDDAMEIIHRYSRGSPRTVIALADLSLLVGYSNHTSKIGFKEVSRAITAMSGQGETLPYMREENVFEKGPGIGVFSSVERNADQSRHRSQYTAESMKITPTVKAGTQAKPSRLFVIMSFLLFCIIVVVAGFYLTSGLGGRGTTRDAAVIRPQKSVPEVMSETDRDIHAETERRDAIPSDQTRTGIEKTVHAAVKAMPEPVKTRKGLVIAEAGNIRSSPDIDSPRIGVIFQGEKIDILEEKTDHDESRWYKIKVYGEKDGWISERVISLQQ